MTNQQLDDKRDGTYTAQPQDRSGLGEYSDAQLLAELVERSKIDRLEVIDENGRAYARGSIYGTPVSVELSLQDANKTLKVFVTTV